MKKEIRVLSLGGSLINSGKININFLRKFRQFIFPLTRKFRFLIVVGGGEIAREYQSSLRNFGLKNQELLDWIGIFATHLNAKLVQIILEPKSKKEILTKLNQKINFQKKEILIGAGTRPGWSTDYDSLWWAKKVGEKTIINATNIDFVYDRPPEKRGAQPLTRLTWEEYFKIVNLQWKAGANFPFDPVASSFAQKNKMKVFIVKGDDFQELKKAIFERAFRGSIIS